MIFVMTTQPQETVTPTSSPIPLPKGAPLGARLALIRWQMKWGTRAEAERAVGMSEGKWARMEEGSTPRDLLKIVKDLEAVTPYSVSDILWGSEGAAGLGTTWSSTLVQPELGLLMAV